MAPENQWALIRRLFDDAIASSLHYSIATVNPDGTPHITPIGSLILTKENKGFYFEVFSHQLPRNLQSNQRICVLAVNSSPLFWLASLFLGKFTAPPAVRLTGYAGERRKATDHEKRLMCKRIGRFKALKGYKVLWGKLDHVRDLHFEAVEPILLGKMTEAVWEAPVEKTDPI